MSQDQKEYQDYLDYMQYQQYVSSQALPGQGEPEQGPASPQEPQGSAAQAALEGFGQTATLGYLPQIQALAGSAMPNPNASVDEDLRAQGFDIQQPESSYLSERDSNIARHRQQAQDHSGAVLGGKALGIAATSLLPGAAASRASQMSTGLGKGAAALGKYLTPSSVKGMAGVGAAQGALYNPGDEEGVLNVAQGPERLGNAALGGAVGGALGAGGKLVSNLTRRGEMIRRIKDSSKLSSSVKGEIDDALQAINQKQIDPRMSKLKEYLQGKSVEINPEMIKEQFPNLAKKMIAKSGAPETSSLMNARAANPKIDISAPRALKLKQALDKLSNYKPAGGAFDPTSVARSEGAKRSADILRGKLSDLGPEVGAINEEVAPMIKAVSSLRRSSNRAPITSITSKPGTDKASLIDLIDELAGSSLEKTATGIKEAQNTLLNPVSLSKPLGALNEFRKLGFRGLIKGGELVDAATPEGTKAALIQSLFEGKR